MKNGGSNFVRLQKHYKICRLHAGVLAIFLAKYFLQFLATLQHELFWKRGILM